MVTVISALSSILGAAHLALALVNHKNLNTTLTGIYLAQKPTDSAKVTKRPDHDQQLDEQ